MEVILKKACQGLGYPNDIVQVNPGYGRNYLIPQGLAIVANEANKKVAQENAKQAAHKALQYKQEAEEIARKLNQLSLEVKAKSGGGEKIFGSVTALQLAKALEKHDIRVAYTAIYLPNPIKTLGIHEATFVLHKEVTCSLSFTVVPE